MSQPNPKAPISVTDSGVVVVKRPVDVKDVKRGADGTFTIPHRQR